MVEQPIRIPVPADQIERYRRHGLALVDIRHAPGWSYWDRWESYTVYSLDVSTLETQPTRAWVRYMLEAPRILLASARVKDVAKETISIDSSKKLESLDVIIRRNHPKLWYDRPVELVPVYQQ